MIPQKVAEIERVDRYKAPLVMEGGSIHTDGEGTLLTTEECLLSPGRNPDLTQEQIEAHLREHIGVEKIVWLARGLDPEETNGHVDDVACFVRPGVVLAAVTDDRATGATSCCRTTCGAASATTMPGAGGSRSTRPACRRSWRSPRTRPWGVDTAEGIDPAAGRRQDRRVVPQLPHRQRRRQSCRRSATRTTTSRTSISPALSRPRGRHVPGREIVLGGGNVHCITQQQPRG